MYSKYIKRFLDFIISLFFLILLIPLFILIIIFIKVDSKGPAFFIQKRVGKNKENFNIYKFRTMKIDAPKDAPTHLLNDPNLYITKLGNLLRKSSIDELPQLLNIVKGDMAIVGPRPALWNQYDLVEEREKYGANDIRPGLTGLAQISGRDELSIEIKSKYDGDYVKNINLLNDINIIIKTFIKVISHDGINEGE